jgi:hypothetical protein
MSWRRRGRCQARFLVRNSSLLRVILRRCKSLERWEDLVSEKHGSVDCKHCRRGLDRTNKQGSGAFPLFLFFFTVIFLRLFTRSYFLIISNHGYSSLRVGIRRQQDVALRTVCCSEGRGYTCRGYPNCFVQQSHPFPELLRGDRNQLHIA